jgi:hypothetical protein
MSGVSECLTLSLNSSVRHLHRSADFRFVGPAAPLSAPDTGTHKMMTSRYLNGSNALTREDN